MRVALRVTAEFCQFVREHETEPSASELSYMMGTIQSGIDSFFMVGYTCRSFAGLEESWIPERLFPSDVAEIRPTALHLFQALHQRDSSPVDRLGSLLSLLRIQFALVAWYFPWGERPPNDPGVQP
jgi:hypothetical protein